MHDNLDVAVLGGGIAGSSLAKYLADRGFHTMLLDRDSFPRHKVCGEFLSPESLSMLNDLGMRGVVESLQPRQMDFARLIFGYGKALELPLPGVALGVSRHSLDTALHDAARRSGVEVRTETTVTAVRPVDGGYVIHTKQGEQSITYQARAVIAAWGGNRRGDLPGRPPVRKTRHAHIGVKSHYSGVPMGRAVELYFFEGGYLGLSPIEGGHVNAAALLNRTAFRNAEKSIPGLIEAACRRNPKLEQKLSNAVPVPGTQSAVAPVLLHRKPLSWELIPHVGDAAVMIPPLCGDGMSMALRSALLCAPLAEKYLRGEISLAEWEEEYTRSIRRDFSGPLRWGRRLQWLLGLPVVPRLLVGAAQLAPGMAYGLVQATRLKGSDY